MRVNESQIGLSDRDWYVAMKQDIDRQNEITDFDTIKPLLKKSSTHLDLSNKGKGCLPFPLKLQNLPL
jgi:hypothetical protein